MENRPAKPTGPDTRSPTQFASANGTFVEVVKYVLMNSGGDIRSSRLRSDLRSRQRGIALRFRFSFRLAIFRRCSGRRRSFTARRSSRHKGRRIGPQSLVICIIRILRIFTLRSRQSSLERPSTNSNPSRSMARITSSPSMSSSTTTAAAIRTGSTSSCPSTPTSRTPPLTRSCIEVIRR